MNKTHFIDALRRNLGEEFEDMSRQDAVALLDAVEKTVVEALKSSDDKEPIPILPGALKVYKRRVAAKPARMGVNPQTGAPMRIKAQPERWAIKVTVLKRLKAAL